MTLFSLDPFLDDDNIVRVGGSLISLNVTKKNPILLPGKIHLVKLIVDPLPSFVKHLETHLTEGAVRIGGFLGN